MARLDSKWIKSEYKEVILFFFTGIIFLLIPLFWGLVFLGFEESFVADAPLLFGSYLVNTLIYVIFTVIAFGLIGFAIARVISIKRNEHPATQKPVSWWRVFTVSFIYAPEENGMLWYLSEKLGFKGSKNLMRWSLKPLRVLMVAILLFGIYGLVQVANPQFTVTGVPQLQLQQITPASEVVFSSFLPAFSENGVLLFVFSLIMGVIAYICVRFNLGKGGFFGLGIGACVLMAFQWGFFHRIVYGNSDVAFWGTVMFGFLGSLLTLLTGIFIFWLIWHLFNNAFFTLSRIVTYKEDVFLVVGIVLGLLLVLWVSVEVFMARRKKRTTEVSIPGD